MGRPAHAGAARHPRPLREGAAAGRPQGRGLPARDHRDRQPDAHPQGRRRQRRAVRLQPAVDPGRHRGRAGRALRHRHLRPARGRHRRLLRAPRGGPRHPAQHHHGRRLRPGHPAAHQAARPAGRGHGRDRGDHHRGHPAAPDGAGGRPRLPDHRRQRHPDQAPVRQPLRHRPVDHRRHPAGHQPPPGRHDLRGRRVRLLRQGPGHARPRPRGQGRRHRGRPDPRPRGGHGGLQGRARWPRRPARPT